MLCSRSKRFCDLDDLFGGNYPTLSLNLSDPTLWNVIVRVIASVKPVWPKVQLLGHLM
jgi:hypothetical protein